jgi:hypothetical protein
VADFRIPLQQAGGLGTEVGAIAVKPDAAGHHFYVFFRKAGRGTVLTGKGTVQQRLDQVLVIVIFHNQWGLMIWLRTVDKKDVFRMGNNYYVGMRLRLNFEANL